MRDWILNLIYSVTGPIRRLAEQVTARLAVLWGNVTRIFGRIRGAWNRLWTSVKYAVYWLINAGIEAYTTFRWLITVWVPMHVRQVKYGILLWATRELSRLGQFLRGLIDTVQRLVMRAVNALGDFVGRLRRWLLAQLGSLWDLAQRMARLVLTLLTDPRRLAEWAAGAMTTAILKYLNAKRNAIGEWLIRRSAAFTLWFARMADDVIARLL